MKLEAMQFTQQKLVLLNPSAYHMCFPLVIISLIFHSGITATITISENKTVPAVMVFGDSIVDSGNNNNLITMAKCNFPPYGRDFMGGKPTGRFSNGKIPSDLIAEEFGVKELLPAYLDPDLQIEDLLTGVSFASGGAGYDPLTAKLVAVYSLSDQLEMLKNWVKKVRAGVGEKRTAITVSKSVFMVCAGSDDIANTYFGSSLRRRHYDIHAYTDLMVASAASFFQELYEVGARRIGVFSAPPIGCVPSQRTLGGGLIRGCAEAYNQAAQLFNSKLSSLLISLNNNLPDARLVYLDIYTPVLALIHNPAQAGFEVVNRGCCGTGNVEVALLCNQHSPGGTCSNASKYLFWDSYHPTQDAYKLLLPLVLRNITYLFF